MTEEWIKQFGEKLDQHYAWPALYTFKFIVPKGREQEVKEVFTNHNTSEKQSKNGNYTSITVQVMANSSEMVISFYRAVSHIQGIIAL